MLFPWPGFFEQLMLADTYLFLDDVQFSKGSFTNRVQLRKDESVAWMTIPLAGNGAFRAINELREARGDWRQRHLEQLRQSLRGAVYLADVLALVERCYARANICDLLIASIEIPAAYMGIGEGQRRLRTSGMGIEGRSWSRVLELVRTVGATRYLTGHGAAGYLNHEAFEDAGVEVQYMIYSKTSWPCHARQFSPFVSVLDLIAHTGPASATYLAPRTVAWREFISAHSKSNAP